MAGAIFANQASTVDPDEHRLILPMKLLHRSRERRESRGESSRGERSESSSRPREGYASRDARPREQDNNRRSREVGYVPAPRVKNDPFFDKPYEAPVRSAEAAPAIPEPQRKSANIKPKRVVAALFKSTT